MTEEYDWKGAKEFFEYIAKDCPWMKFHIVDLDNVDEQMKEEMIHAFLVIPSVDRETEAEVIMEDFTILQSFAVVLASIVMLVLAICIVALGNIIEATPDGRERMGGVRDEKAKNAITSPKNISKVYAGLLIILYIVGVIICYSGASKIFLIVGSVVMFSALLFAGTIMIFELIIYNTMRGNMKIMKMGVT